MKVEYSKAFQRAIDKLSGKMLTSVLNMIRDVKNAESVENITDCKKLVGYKSVYRIRIGDYRAFFILHIRIEKDNTVIFEYLVSRGGAYDKKMESSLHIKDKDANK